MFFAEFRSQCSVIKPKIDIMLVVAVLVVVVAAAAVVASSNFNQ
jgi:hypothetical protein